MNATNNSYFAILDRLRKCSDRVAIVPDMNWHEDKTLLDKLKPYFLFSEWKKNYPGNSCYRKVKLCFYKICPEVVEVFKRYNSFLETGYDLVFFQDKKPTFSVIFHEYCYFVEKPFEKYFSDLSLPRHEDCLGDIHPNIPDFVEEED